MKKIIFILIIGLVGMEVLGYWFYKKSKNPNIPIQNQVSQVQQQEASEAQSVNTNDVGIETGNFEGFPPPSVEIVDGISVRTIHMGVRQWAWDPAEIEAKEGEKVVLIMHNADVLHSISIPEFSVKQDIPEEGAVVIFIANKKGTFEFSCATPCGSGHKEMRGKITII